jgi:hypothetical protein
MQIPGWAIPNCITKQYNLPPLVHDGHVMTEIWKGMYYGLPQAGLIAYKCLIEHSSSMTMPLLDTLLVSGAILATLPILFSLVVDDFGITHLGQQLIICTARSVFCHSS